MKNTSLCVIPILSTLIGLGSPAFAATKQAVKKAGHSLENLYSEREIQKADQAYLWGVPTVEMAEWQEVQKAVFKAAPNDFATYRSIENTCNIGQEHSLLLETAS